MLINIFKKKHNSTVTFEELTRNLAFVKIIYNGKTIYDDVVGEETPEHLLQIQKEYANKVVYRMKIKIVHFHHCILNIKGE